MMLVLVFDQRLLPPRQVPLCEVGRVARSLQQPALQRGSVDRFLWRTGTSERWRQISPCRLRPSTVDRDVRMSRLSPVRMLEVALRAFRCTKRALLIAFSARIFASVEYSEQAVAKSPTNSDEPKYGVR